MLVHTGFKSALLIFAMSSSVVFADTALGKPAQNVPKSPTPINHDVARQERNAGVCMLSAQGAYTAAVERQAGKSKDSARKTQAIELQPIQAYFSHRPYMVDFIKSNWQVGLDLIYNEPIQSDEAKKKAFISQVTEIAFNNCMDSFEGQ